MKNCFSIDLEDWFQGNEYISYQRSSEFEDRVEYSSHLLLDLLDLYSVKATFFVLGHLAESKPKLIGEIHKRGHEIASHGYSHELIYRQTPAAFREELRKAKNICEDIIGEALLGHRASNWSITKKSLWALDIIQDLGFVYDSSIFPTENYLFGIPDAPRFSHSLPNGLLEIPPSTVKLFKKNIPFSGGFFLRTLPLSFAHWAIKRVNGEGHPAMIYIHPWELDSKQPRDLPVPFKNKVIHYWGLGGVHRKLHRLFKEHQFGRIDEIYKLKPAVALK